MDKTPARFSLLTYLKESAQPFVSLLFVLPIILTYEVGVRIINIGEEHPTVNGADKILKEFLDSLGFYGSTLSAVAIIITLLFMHMHKRLPWRFNHKTLLGMAGESILLALPVFFLQEAVEYALMAAGIPWQEYLKTLILCLGAGVYEEYLFRLIGLGLLLAIIREVSKIDRFREFRSWLNWCAILTSALLFSAFHHFGEYGDPWVLNVFAFRTLVGVYFAWLYLNRGFGIAVGCHTAYNLMVMALRVSA